MLSEAGSYPSIVTNISGVGVLVGVAVAVPVGKGGICVHVAVGAGSDAVNQRLAEKYQPDCTLDHAILLAVECLAKVAEGPPDPAKMRVATIPATTKTMTSLPQEALGEYLRRVTT